MSIESFQSQMFTPRCSEYPLWLLQEGYSIVWLFENSLIWMDLPAWTGKWVKYTGSSEVDCLGSSCCADMTCSFWQALAAYTVPRRISWGGYRNVLESELQRDLIHSSCRRLLGIGAELITNVGRDGIKCFLIVPFKEWVPECLFTFGLTNCSIYP